jgi:hypothetical protein
MGLGPPVCTECRVIGELTPEDHPNYGIEVRYGSSYWQCPICGTPELGSSLFTCGISEDELDGNERFLKFMKGPDNGD